MEFLKALELAKEQGLSNQEFIAVWEAEAKMSLKREEAKMMELKTAGTPQIPQLDTAMAFKTEMNGLPEFRTETLTQELRNQMHWQKEELKEQFEQKIQSIHSHLAESQAEHWQQTLQNHNTALEEIRQHFMVMFGHVTTTVESQINALKLYFMQEMELMKQDLVGKIHALLEEKDVEHARPGASKIGGTCTKGIGVGSEIDQYKTPASSNMGVSAPKVLTFEQFELVQLNNKEQVLLQQQEDSLQQQQYVKALQEQQNIKPLPQQLQETMLQQQKQPQLQPIQSEQPRQQHPNLKAPQQQESQQQQQQQANVQQPTNQLQQQNGKSENGIVQVCDPSTSYAAVAALKTGLGVSTQDAHNTNEAVEDESEDYEISLPLPGSEVPPTYSSVAGTGFFAEMISSRMKKRGTSPASSVGSRSRSSVSSRGRTTSQKEKKQQSASSNSSRRASTSSTTARTGAATGYLPVPEALLTIKNCDEFCAKSLQHATQFYYTTSDACKMRILVRFNEQKQLKVCLLLSNGSKEDSRRWPLVISGKGYVYQKPSEGYTKVWEFPQMKCNQPEPGKEVSYPARVCLATKRASPQPNVTYETLETKGYMFNNRCHFSWCLKADENVNRSS